MNIKNTLLTSYFLFALLLSNCAFAEFELPKARFFKDSIKIGEPVKLSLIYKHKPDQEILFPDSTYNFFPFEFTAKQYFTTASDSIESTDSIVYTLTTFEFSNPLKLSLPVYIFEKGDTSLLFSDEAEIYLAELIPQVTSSDSLKTNTQYNVLDSKVNYPYILIGLGALLLIAGVVLVFFRKSIIKRYKIYLMKRDYDYFIKNFELTQQAYRLLPSTRSLEELLSVWKKYLQKLERIPYTTLTTKEISKLFEYNQLTSSLQNFDRAIYGGMVNEDLNNSINYLKETAAIKYQSNQEEIKNA